MQQGYKCPKCNSPISYGAQSCNSCGQSFTWQHQPQPPTQQPIQAQQYQQQYQQPQQPWAGYQQQYQQVEPSKKKINMWLIGCMGLIAIAAIIGGIVLMTSTSTPETSSNTPESESGREITLVDAPVILNMSLDLPARFEHLDAASEGMSNEDLGLGPEYSEPELFISEEPYQMVFASLYIAKSRLDRISSDAFIKDQERVKDIVIKGLQAGTEKHGYTLSASDIDVQVTYPSVGNLAVQGAGAVRLYGTSSGYAILMFRRDYNYVMIASLDFGEGISLVPLAEAIDKRIQTLK